MKCCANCFWCFTIDDEENVEGYSENDPNKPQAGDCTLGQIHNDDYYCEAHQYIDGMEEYKNYIFYDDNYLGPGYLLVQKLDDEIIRFMKISSYGENGFPNFSIRAYEKDSYDKPNQEFRKITFKISSEEPLYDVISNLSKELNDTQIKTIDSYLEGNNYFKANSFIEEAEIIFYKDIYGVKHRTDFIDINLGDNDTCGNYIAIVNFYNELSKLSVGKITETDIKKLLYK